MAENDPLYDIGCTTRYCVSPNAEESQFVSDYGDNGGSLSIDEFLCPNLLTKLALILVPQLPVNGTRHTYVTAERIVQDRRWLTIR